MPVNTSILEYIIGFDLGHAETALAAARVDDTEPPIALELYNKRSWVTAYLVNPNGVAIGLEAVLSPAATDPAARLHIAFKKRPDTSAEAKERLSEYAGIILKQLSTKPQLRSSYQIILGCPSGWNKNTVECYREAMASVVADGTLDIQSESLGAMMEALERGVSREHLSDAALVIDAGSSTLDFTFVHRCSEAGEMDMGRPLSSPERSPGRGGIQTPSGRNGPTFLPSEILSETAPDQLSGGVDLGAGLLDEVILQHSLKWPENAANYDALKEAMTVSTYRGQLLMVCRKAKETFFQKTFIGSNFPLKTPKGRLRFQCRSGRRPHAEDP